MQSFLSVKAEIWLGNAVYCFVYSDIIAFCIFKVSCILQCWHGCLRVRKQQVLTSVSAEGGSSHPLGTSQGSINQSFTYHCTLQLKIRDYRLHTWKSCPRVARWCKHRSWLICDLKPIARGGLVVGGNGCMHRQYRDLALPAAILQKSGALRMRSLPTLGPSQGSGQRQMSRAVREGCATPYCTCSVVTRTGAVVKVHHCLHT